MKFAVSLLTVVLTTLSPAQATFQRLSTFNVCSQISPTCNTSQRTNAEIVAASVDGNTLIYTDADFKRVGFVNIVDAANPLPAGTINVAPGTPNSVAVRGMYALACIDTSANLVNVSGYVAVIDIATRAIVRNITVSGQPDSIVTFGSIAAVAIENENGGALPQLPGGSVVIINTASSDPANWTIIDVNVTSLPGANFGTDPEPEFVAINSQGMIAVTLQENNAIVLINGTTGAVITSYSMGSVNLTNVDIVSDSIVDQTGSTTNIERQADGITWIDDQFFATANEGDFGTGGSRTFSVFNASSGSVVFDSASFLDQHAVRIGNYPESRIIKGVEPETVLAATFDGKRHLFVVSERANVVYVYDATNPQSPVFLQVLPCSTSGPEGIVAIPSRNLLAVANEVDNRMSKFRSTITIFRNAAQPSIYPSLQSENRTASTFIPFSALSGLAASPSFGSTPSAVTTLYTIEDSAFRASRILTIEVTSAGAPYKVKTELRIKDNSGLLAGSFAGFSSINVATRINADKTVNIDPEGIAISRTNSGTVWVVSEGAGPASAITLPNQLLRVNLTDGNIITVVNLPDAVNAIHTNNGFEGVAEYGNFVVITFQREWVGEARPRLGIYNYVTASWKFVFYPLDAYASQLAGGWVGLSDIAPIGNGKFLILERDNNGGPDAANKKLYEIDLGSNLTLLAENITVTKQIKLDMMPILATKWGLMPEKVEGAAIDAMGNVWVLNDNDGVANNAGEQQLNLMGPLYAIDLPSASPSASPKKAPVAVPVPVSVPVPVPVVPVPVPVVPVPVPVVPVPVPVVPVPVPVVPVPVPVKAPVPVPVPVKAPVPVPVKAPVPVPVKAPVPVPVPVPDTDSPTESPVDAPTRSPCGLFGLSIFCPLTFCGIFGRFLFGSNLC